jgi:hypothetical protein
MQQYSGKRDAFIERRRQSITYLGGSNKYWYCVIV